MGDFGDSGGSVLSLCLKGTNTVTIRAEFQHGMESMSYFKMNTVTKNYWLIYAAAIMTLSCALGCSEFWKSWNLKL